MNYWERNWTLEYGIFIAWSNSHPFSVQEARQEVMNRGMELTEVQDGVREAENAAKVRSTEGERLPRKQSAFSSFQRELVKYDKLIRNVQTDEVALDEKIAKRLEEKDRYQRRLDMLKSVRYVKSARFVYHPCKSFILARRI